MNPSSGETPGISLPPPLAEQPAAGRVERTAKAEQPAAAPETAPKTAAVQPAIQLPVTPLHTNNTPSGATSTTTTAVSPVSDDGDKIEKEWVDKVKRIIASTRQDPYRQSEELTAVKADYMKQRYNKIIKAEK
jgi:hypothetical protein